LLRNVGAARTSVIEIEWEKEAQRRRGTTVETEDKALVCTSIGLAALSPLLSGGIPKVEAACPDEPCASPPCCNGDVNGDGSIDIADPVLAYLLAEGPEPQSIHCRLPATGQDLCYDTAGNVIDCESEEYPGKDGSYQAGCPTEGRFFDNGDGTVTDTCTSLMWQQATADVDNDGLIDAGNDALTWAEALRYCENLVLCGDGTWRSSILIDGSPDAEEIDEHGGILWDDWRLPNVKELMSLADSGRYGPDPVYSLELPGEGWTVWYRSSSSPVNPSARPGTAANVYFRDGADAKTSPGYVLAVRC
jgi:hypothetical protein